jgi:putative ABC transport system ATP-binding protein
MELRPELICRRLEFQWPGDDPPQPPVLQSVTATFSPGTVYLIGGDTGAGKSTLLHLLAGLLRPSAGEVWADGQPVSRWPANHRDPWRRRVGMVFQHLALIPDLSVAENLMLPLIPRKRSWADMQADVGRQLTAADLAAQAAKPARALSGGQRQRLAVARALVGAPRYVLADEPTAFQDDSHTDRMIDQLRTAADGGAVVVVCSQDPRVKASAAIDQYLYLSSGRLSATPIPGKRP